MSKCAVAFEAGEHGEYAVNGPHGVEAAECGIAPGDPAHEVATMGDAHEVFEASASGHAAEFRAVGVDQRH